MPKTPSDRALRPGPKASRGRKAVDRRPPQGVGRNCGQEPAHRFAGEASPAYAVWEYSAVCGSFRQTLAGNAVLIPGGLVEKDKAPRFRHHPGRHQSLGFRVGEDASFQRGAGPPGQDLSPAGNSAFSKARNTSSRDTGGSLSIIISWILPMGLEPFCKTTPNRH
jgi:hypothetical protein